MLLKTRTGKTLNRRIRRCPSWDALTGQPKAAPPTQGRPHPVGNGRPWAVVGCPVGTKYHRGRVTLVPCRTPLLRIPQPPPTDAPAVAAKLNLCLPRLPPPLRLSAVVRTICRWHAAYPRAWIEHWNCKIGCQDARWPRISSLNSPIEVSEVGPELGQQKRLHKLAYFYERRRAGGADDGMDANSPGR